MAQKHIDPGERERLRETAESELLSLHEGNFARYHRRTCSGDPGNARVRTLTGDPLIRITFPSFFVIAGLVPATHGTSGYESSPAGPPVGMGCGMFNARLKRLFEDIGSNIVIARRTAASVCSGCASSSAAMAQPQSLRDPICLARKSMTFSNFTRHFAFPARVENALQNRVAECAAFLGT